MTHEEENKQLKKHKGCTICFVVTGIILIITAAFTPKVMDSLLLFAAKESSQLTAKNEPNWKNIPGANDIGIYWNQYFYNCTNAEDVIYRSKKPEFQEFGPYVYREFDNYDDLEYAGLDNIISQEDLPAVYNTFTVGDNFSEDKVGNIDEPMYLTNQALFGVWYQQNAANTPEQQWRVYLTLLYSAIQDGLGRQVIENGVYAQMTKSVFKTQERINKDFVPVNKVSDDQEKSLWEDPWYGLSNELNYPHWNTLMYTTDPVKKQEQLAWLWEIRTYFGLSYAQVMEMQVNWNLFFNDKMPIVVDSIPSMEPYLDQTGVAYWQWADSYITMYDQEPVEQPSVSYASDTVTGYVEFSYWLDYYCNPERAGGMSAANWEIFKDVKMWRSKSTAAVTDGGNMEHLWNLSDPVTGEDPAGNSLFNLTTLQELIVLGQNEHNILTGYEKDLVFDTDFGLSQNWTNLADTLDLYNEKYDTESSEIGTKRAYLLWLWMNTTWDLTFEQAQNGGNFQIGVIGTLGATAFYETMTTMQLEFPMLELATWMTNDVTTKFAAGGTCQDIYVSLSFTTTTADTVCAASSGNFTFSDKFQTAVAITNMYLYQTGFNREYYDEFASLTGLDAASLNSTFYDTGSQFESYFLTLLGLIKTNYAPQEITKGVQLDLPYCSFSNLTYNQWMDNQILGNPAEWQESLLLANSTGYVKNFGKWATGWITPEYGYWKEMNQETSIDPEFYTEAIDQTYFAFNTSGLFNGKKFQDVLIYEDPSHIPSYFPRFDDYLRSVTINFGLSGLLTVRSPREMIEGYTDPLVATLNETPIYMGGDNTTSPILALNDPPTHPKDNTVAFFTGEDDYTMTRTYGQWLGQEYIVMKGKQYTSLTKIEDFTYSPWREPVLLDGTDGMQFNPDQKEDEPLRAFVNDLSRNCYFDYSHTDTDTYPGLEKMVFDIQLALMQNETANPVNANFDVKITGSTNMTTSLNAYGFAAKGHYYQMSEVAASSQPIIRDQDGNQITTDADVDDTYLGVERLSGVCLEAKERIFFNMQVFGDSLFKYDTFDPEIPADFGFFFPLAFIKRENFWTQDQVDTVFGPLVLGKKLKWVFFGLLLLFGLIFAALSFFCGYKYHNLKKSMNPQSDSVLNSANRQGNRTSSDGDEYGPIQTPNRTLLDKDEQHRTDSSKDFDDDKPNMAQQERVFNLHGQGKPIAELSQYSGSQNISNKVVSGETDDKDF